jgi:hypothetical protein
MTDYSAAYTAMAAARDDAMLRLGIMAMATIATNYSIGLLPKRLQSAARWVFLLGGLVLAVGSILVES